MPMVQSGAEQVLFDELLMRVAPPLPRSVSHEGRGKKIPRPLAALSPRGRGLGRGESGKLVQEIKEVDEQCNSK